jgi:AcrR family transcriptional regulator
MVNDDANSAFHRLQARITALGGGAMRKPPAGALSRDDWIVGARKLLVRSGIAAVRIEPLARKLKVTPGSFYWHFSGREDLYDALLDDWYSSNTAPLRLAIENAGPDPERQYWAFFGVWVLELGFDPAYDRAVRDWGKTSRKVALRVQGVDADVIALLTGIFERFGYRGLEATMRARVTYYHQVGYYALGVKEEREGRLALAPYYAEILTGPGRMTKLATVADIRAAMLGR